jgi:hypothetical protein
MPDDFKYLSPSEFQKLGKAARERYLNDLYEHLHGLPQRSSIERQDLVDYCPFCGAFLCRIYGASGERSADSAAVASDEHGKHSICLNPACRRRVELVEVAGAWVVSSAQQED